MSPFVLHFDLEKIDLKILATTIYDYELIPAKQILKRLVDNYLNDTFRPYSQNMPMQLQPLQQQFHQQPPPRSIQQQMQYQMQQKFHQQFRQQPPQRRRILDIVSEGAKLFPRKQN
uniref:Uncharacterized protein n=1 Tax=Panagrolaimus davidi TaxID=227884 RepID=A0A914Q5T9_9BILA